MEEVGQGSEEVPRVQADGMHDRSRSVEDSMKEVELALRTLVT